jgi:hypothetical protein
VDSLLPTKHLNHTTLPCCPCPPLPPTALYCSPLPSTAPPPRPPLQCLYANPAFRQAVYGVRQPLADEPIVKELR